MTQIGDDDVVLRLEGVTKVYSGTVAVKQVDFEIRRGAVNVLVGENGAGKSTLMKIIAGVESPTLGRILLDGEPVVFADAADAAARGVGIVFQELNLFGNLSVAENIFAARELARGGLRIDHRLQERRAGALLDRLEAGIDPRTLVEDLRIGQQQLVEIAKAVAKDARILILDEPTSALSASEVEVLFRIIGDLKARGVAIVYISHRLEELDPYRRFHHRASRRPRDRAGADGQCRCRLDRSADDRIGVQGFRQVRAARDRRGSVPRRRHLPAARRPAATRSITSRCPFAKARSSASMV